MDGKRFDDLSRALAQGRTRRGVLKGLAGGLAAGVAALTGRGAADAQRLPNGSACTRATQCASLKCADGVCCTAACTGQCEACNLQGAVGTCLPVPAGTQQHGNRPACTGTAVCQASCDGFTRTHCTQYPGLDISCAPGECDNGWGYTYGCGGDGTCHPLGESCGLYVCDSAGVACLDTCASDADCVGEAFCFNGTCQEDRPLGDPCTADAQCASGICAQGVCCASACPGGCRACNVAGNLGFCTEIPDGGVCDGGVCCDGDCVNTQTSLEHCGACDNVCRLLPTPGTCEDDPICQAGVCTFTPLPRGTVCRESAGVCDPREECDGQAITCPPNAFHPPTFVCRASAGDCDPAEFCTGIGPDCPLNLLAPATQLCRAAAGLCDVAENCTGSSAQCPPDAFLPSSVVCRPGGTGPNAVCDPPENCPGNAAACPLNSFAGAGTPCNDGNPQTVNDRCNGQGVCVGVPGIDLRRVGGGNMEVDDDLDLYVNGQLVFSEHDTVITTYPPFDLNLVNGDQLRVVATNAQPIRAHVDPFELFRPTDGATQVLDPVGFDESGFGAGLILGVFYDRTFTVNLP